MLFQACDGTAEGGVWPGAEAAAHAPVVVLPDALRGKQQAGQVAGEDAVQHAKGQQDARCTSGQGQDRRASGEQARDAAEVSASGSHVR